MKNKSFTSTTEVKSMWFVQMGLRSRWLAVCLVLFCCLISSYQASAQQYTYDFSTPAALSKSYPGDYYTTVATFTVGGVSYTISGGINGNLTNISSGGNNNSAALRKDGAGGESFTLKRTDGGRFQFYGFWLKQSSISGYPGTPPYCTISLRDGSSTLQTFVENSAETAKLYTTDHAVTSVQVSFNGVLSHIIDDIKVGPAAISLPTLSTTSASNINSTFATAGGNVSNDGGSTITERGVVWSTTSNPTTSSNKLTVGTGTGTFSGQITGLAANTTYYVRAYAVNSAGTAYGSQVSFTTTDAAGPVTLTPTLDTSFDASGSYPNEKDCYVGYASAWGQESAALKFSLTPVSGNVTSAKLRLYVNYTSGASPFVKVWSSTNETWTSSITSSPATNQALGQVSATAVNSWIEVDVTDYIKAQVAGSKIASLVVTGNTSSSPGEVYFNSMESTTNQPQLVVTTGAALSSNADLSSINLSAGTLSPVFAAGTTSYTATVANSVSSINITPTLADAKATLKVNGVAVTSGSASNIPLAVGNNVITVLATAEDGTTKTYSVNVTRSAPSLPTNAISFNGFNQYINVPNNSAFEYGTGTVELWVKPDWTPGSKGANPCVLSMRADAGGSTRYSLHMDNYLTSLGVWNGSAYNTLPYTFTKGQWYHIAVVMKSTGHDFYVNGVYKGSIGSPINTAVKGLNFKIGASEISASSAYTKEFFLGEMDDIRVWNTMRTASEIANNYQNELTVPASGLVAYYKIDAGITADGNKFTKVATDYSGNAYNGTVVNYFNDADLKALAISAGTLSPAFATLATNYSATVSNTTATINITPTTSDSKATVDINGGAATSGSATLVNLAFGSNTINVKVTAQDGKIKTYTINVTRQLSSNADLSNLTINSGTLAPVFTSGTTSYSVTLPSGTTSVGLTPTMADASATVMVNGTNVTSGNAHNVTLSTGSNTITVLVTAQNGSTKTYTINANVAYPALLASISSQTNIACNGGSSGNATVAASGGVAPYTYSWSPTGGTGATATGLSAGTYTVTVTDKVGQTKQVSATLTQPTAISISIASTDVSCNGGSNGTATATVTGGAGFYTYKWSNDVNDASITGLAFGTYTLFVTDANGCEASKSVTITEPSALGAFAVLDANVSCNGGNDGGATVNAVGGAGSYTYKWSNNAITASITGVAAGEYTVTVTDANGCTATDKVIVTEPAALAAMFTHQDATIFGGTDGAATIEVTGGTPNYTYSWAPYGGNGATASNLATGEYTVTVKDGNDCSAQFKVFIDEPKEVSVVSIARAFGAHTKASYLIFQVKFSGKLDGLVASNLSLNGIPSAYIDGVTKVADDTYNVGVTLPAAESGELSLTVANDTGLPAAITNAPYTGTETYNVDHIAPANPTAPALAASSDTGVSNSDRLTNATSLTITGETEANATVKIYINKIYAANVNADASGNWAATVFPTLAAGFNELNITVDAADELGNTSAQGSALIVKVERDAPVASLTYAGATNVNAPFSVEVKFDEEVYGLSTEDFDVSNGTVTNLTTTDAANYTITVTPTSNGWVTLFLKSASVTDEFGNQNGVSNSIEVKYDDVRPQVSLASSAAPVINTTFEVEVTFTEAVTGFEQSDVTVTNGIASAFEALSATQYKVTVSPDAEGEVKVAIAENVAQDAATNGNEASESLTRLYDVTKPSVVLATTAPEVLNTPFTVTFTFTESVSGFALGDISVTNSSASDFAKLSNTEYTALITPAADGEVTVMVAADVANDAATNGNEASETLSRVYDATKPIVVLATTAADPTNAAFTVNFTFNEDVFGFEVADITVENGTASAFNKVDAQHYSALITPTVDGLVKVSLAAGVTADLATNPNEASEQLSLTYDATAPAGYTIAINTNRVDVTNVTNISLSVAGAEVGTTYTYAITSDNGGTPVTGTGEVQQAGFDLNSLDLSGLNDGNLTATIYLVDAAGNKGADVTAQVIKITRDIVSVTTPELIKVPIRTTYANVPLPAKVEVTYSTGAKEQIGVIWSQGNYNGLVAGPYELTGELVLAPMTTNITNQIAKIIVEVQPNKVPTALAFSTTTFKPEATANDALGTLTTTDPDDVEFVYELVSGAGDQNNDLFEIRNDKVYLKSNKGLSGVTSLSFRVKSTDPYLNTIEKSFTLSKELYSKPEDQLKIVNAFSPDGDGINDTWFIPELRFYNSVVIEVFDRSGVRVFQTTNPEEGWNGKDANGQVRKGAFFYIVQVKDINMVKKGVVTILKK